MLTQVPAPAEAELGIILILIGHPSAGKIVSRTCPPRQNGRFMGSSLTDEECPVIFFPCNIFTMPCPIFTSLELRYFCTKKLGFDQHEKK